MKKIISVFLTAALITISNISLSAATAIPSNKDPFGTSAFGPGAPEVTVDGYYIPSELNYFKQHKKYLEISVKVNGEILPLYISFPELGGFRLYGEKTGFFEPDSMVDISYEYDAACDLKMTGTDGTTVIFRKKGLAFYLDVNNKNGKTLFTIKSSQIKLGYSDGEVKKIRFDMPLASDEVIFGSGERFNSLDQNGRRTIMWNVDCGYHGQSQTAELWRGYKNVPVLHSSIGYTLFYNSFYSATVDIGYSNPKIYSLDFCGNEFDIYFWSGTAKENLVKYTDLTLNNCTAVATVSAENASYVQNNNGATTNGFAVVSTDNTINNQTPKPEGTITINGGSYTGLIGLHSLPGINENFPGFADTTYVIK